MKHMAQRPSQQGHDGKLSHTADEYIHRTPYEDTEVMGAQRTSHGEHDKSQDYAGHIPPLHPSEEVGKEHGYHGHQNDKGGRIGGQQGT